MKKDQKMIIKTSLKLKVFCRKYSEQKLARDMPLSWTNKTKLG